jgi:hypothetical protein
MKRAIISVFAAMSLVSCQSDVVPDETTILLPTTTSSISTSTTNGSTTTTVSVPELESAIYVFFEGYPVAPGPYLVAVSRPGIDQLDETLTTLLEGVTEEESGMGLASTIPAGTKLLDVEVTDGVALVDLSREFESGGGSLSMMGRVAQIVYTATRFDGVDYVRFSLEGAPLDVLGGEGLIIDEPQARSDWVDLIPPILLEEPTWGSTPTRDLTVSGIAELESGTLSYVIVDADGLIIHEGQITTIPGKRSEFSADLALEEIPNTGTGSIIAWEWAPDGSQRHVLEYPLNLVD